MDLDSAALWFATRSDKTHDALVRMGLTRKLLNGAAKQAWDFIGSYRTEHGSIPPAGVVAERFGVAVAPPQQDDEEVSVAHTYVVDQLWERAQHKALLHGLGESEKKLEEGEQTEAVAEVIKLADYLRKSRTSQLQVHSLAQTAEDVYALYERIERGEIGVPFPWEVMTNMTLGMWPGTLTFYVARPGVGKTWTAVIIAMHAWSSGKRVLIVSPELARVELSERMVSKYGQIPYKDMVSATLGTIGKPHLRKVIDELKQKGHNLFILDNEEKLQPEYIEQAILMLEPDLVIFDSIYMLRVEDGKVKKGPGSKGAPMERLISTIDWMRMLSRRQWSFAPDGLPLVGIHQLSREGKVRKEAARNLKQGRGTGGLEDAVALSDALFWNAHNLFAMYQDEYMRQDKQLLYVPLKVRRQAMASSLVVKWDMETMDFSQIGTRVTESDEYKDEEGSAVPY